MCEGCRVVEIMMKNQRLIMIQFLVFAILFGGVLVISAVIYSKTTVYDLEKQKEKRDITSGFEKLGKSTKK